MRRALERLLEAAHNIADPSHPLGVRARAVLPQSTRLDPRGVELALRVALERSPAPEHLAQLQARVRNSPRAHVLLSANVFTAALRAIALAVCASEQVYVRASRREPHMAALLHEGAPGSFHLVSELAPQPGDQLWVYGSAATLVAVREHTPPGVVIHEHGPGFGVAIARETTFDANAHDVVAGLARDIVLFDQRGCLSPRLLLVQGSAHFARDLAAAVARALSELEREVPIGAPTPQELAEQIRYRDSWLYAGEMFAAGSGLVSFDADGERLVIPPARRNLHVVCTHDPLGSLAPMRTELTALATHDPAWLSEIGQHYPQARCSLFGAMQCPPLDGPVDLRGL